MGRTLKLALCLALTTSLLADRPGAASSGPAGQNPPPPASPPPAQAPLVMPKMTGTGIVFGTVVADATGRPVKGASVAIIVFSDAATFVKSAKTDRRGRFLVGGLGAAQIRVSASAPGFLSTNVGQSGADDNTGTFIPLAEGEIAEPITLRLRRGAAVSGAVVDEAGEPICGVAVQAYRRSFVNGSRQFAPSESGRTDDRGVYRIAGLIPGTYVVGVVPRVMEADNDLMAAVANSGSVTATISAALANMIGIGMSANASAQGELPMIEGLTSTLLFAGAPIPSPPGHDGKSPGYAATFFPGVPPARAVAMTLGAAEERTGADFQISEVTVSTIAGHVVGPDGSPPAQTALTLVPVSPGGDEEVQIGDTLTSLAGASGEFTFPYVPPGTYSLEARAVMPVPELAPPGFAPHRLWASVPVVADGKTQADLAVMLREGVSLSGEVRFDGTRPPVAGAALTAMNVYVSSRAPQQSLAATSPKPTPIDADGHFTFAGALVPGEYGLHVGSGLPSPWVLASVVAEGRESIDGVLRVSAQDIEHAVITMTDRVIELTGAVTDADGKPNTTSTVIVFPRDSRLWTPNSRRIVGVRPTSDGRYQIKDLPPGDYWLAVVRTVERGQWFDPDFLKSVQATATRVTLAAGEKRTLDLQGR